MIYSRAFAILTLSSVSHIVHALNSNALTSQRLSRHAIAPSPIKASEVHPRCRPLPRRSRYSQTIHEFPPRHALPKPSRLSLPPFESVAHPPKPRTACPKNSGPVVPSVKRKGTSPNKGQLAGALARHQHAAASTPVSGYMSNLPRKGFVG
jgi:hypothetical protein